MNSIIQSNRPPANRFVGWQTRLDEVDVANEEDVRDLARHHFLHAQHYLIANIKTVLTKYTTAVSSGRARDIGNAARAAFDSFRVFDRLGPGIAAIKKIASGRLPKDLEAIEQQIWQVLDAADKIREAFYAKPPSKRRTVNLALDLAPLCDELHRLILDFYRVARTHFNLPEIVICGST